MAYLIDSDVFIEAKNRHYGFDFCPAFWDWLAEESEAGRVMSVEKVGNELLAGADALSEWATERGTTFFVPPDAAVLPALGAVSAWVTTPRYEQAAINIFLGSADYYLVAHSLAHSHTVVTHEQPRNSPKVVKIPEVCIGLGVTCVSPFEMLRLSGARFVLPS